MGRRTPGILWIAAGATLWGTDTVLRRPLTSALHPTQIVLWEHIILTLLVSPVLIRYSRQLRKIEGSVWLAILGTAWIGSALATVLFTTAIRSGNPTTAVLLQKTQPIFAIALASSALGEHLPPRFLWTALAAMAGAYLVAFGDGHLLAPASSFDLQPALLALGAAAGWAAATIWGRIATKRLPFEIVTALRVTCALPALIVAAFVQGQLAAPGRNYVPSLLWMAVVPGFAGLMLYYRGLRQTPASQSTIAELAFPITASLLNWLVLGAQAGAIQILGFALVWASIFKLSRAREHHGT
jgi:drug/metabolite transporter, DME family